jgi:uncharacterized Zn-binding protein involved in type VI secretion
LKMPDLEAARVGDMHTCPSNESGPTPHVGGPILKGSDDVSVEDKDAARVGDPLVCVVGGPDYIVEGSETVLLNDKFAARNTSRTDHDGVVIGHAKDVWIGGPTIQIRKPHRRTGEAARGAESATKSPTESLQQTPQGAGSNTVPPSKEIPSRADHDLAILDFIGWENRNRLWSSEPGDWWFVNLAARTSVKVLNHGPQISKPAEVLVGVQKGTSVIELARFVIPELPANTEFVQQVELRFPMSRTDFFGEVMLIACLCNPGSSPKDYSDAVAANNQTSQQVVLVDPLLPTRHVATFSYGSPRERSLAWWRTLKTVERLGGSVPASLGTWVEWSINTANEFQSWLEAQVGLSSFPFPKTWQVDSAAGQRSWRDGEVKGKGAFRSQIIAVDNSSDSITLMQQGDEFVGEPNPAAAYTHWGWHLDYVRSWHARNDF